jgi:hypothetical protein
VCIWNETDGVLGSAEIPVCANYYICNNIDSGDIKTVVIFNDNLGGQNMWFFLVLGKYMMEDGCLLGCCAV